MGVSEMGGGAVAVVGGLQQTQVALQSFCPQACTTRYTGIMIMVMSMIPYAAEQLRRSL